MAYSGCDLQTRNQRYNVRKGAVWSPKQGEDSKIKENKTSCVSESCRTQEKCRGMEQVYRVYGDVLFVMAVCWMKTWRL